MHRHKFLASIIKTALPGFGLHSHCTFECGDKLSHLLNRYLFSTDSLPRTGDIRWPNNSIKYYEQI